MDPTGRLRSAAPSTQVTETLVTPYQQLRNETLARDRGLRERDDEQHASRVVAIGEEPGGSGEQDRR